MVNFRENGQSYFDVDPTTGKIVTGVTFSLPPQEEVEKAVEEAEKHLKEEYDERRRQTGIINPEDLMRPLI